MLSNFDKSVLEEETKSSQSKVVSSDKDMKLIINELMGRANVFNEIPGGKYKHACPLNKSVFHKVDHKTLESWIHVVLGKTKLSYEQIKCARYNSYDIYKIEYIYHNIYMYFFY